MTDAALLTPTDVVAPPSQDDVRTLEIGYLRLIPGNPIDDWEPGAWLRSIFEIDALTLHDLMLEGFPAILAGGIPAFSTGDWLELLAQQWFAVRKNFSLDGVRIGDISTVQTLLLSCDASHGPFVIVAGQFWAAGRTGNRYVATTGGTLNTADTLTITIKAEGPGSKWNDPAGTITALLTKLPGVTCVNVAANFSPVARSGTSTGSVTPSLTVGGVTPTPKTFRLRIDASGQVSGATTAWSYSTDGGRTYASAGRIVASFALPGGTTVVFANGAITPSFVVGDVFSFQTPGSSIVTRGADPEIDSALTSRCNARWPDLDAIPQEDRIIKWAKKASTEVVRCKLQKDPLRPGLINLVMAGAVSGVSGGAVSDVQAYVDKRMPIGDLIAAQSATVLEVTAGAFVTVKTADLARVQNAAQSAWQAYLRATDIGGTVKLAKLEQILMDAGAVDVDTVQLNAVFFNLFLDGTQIAVLPAATPLLADQLSWVVV